MPAARETTRGPASGATAGRRVTRRVGAASTAPGGLAFGIGLGLICLLALGLRLWGLRTGLPYVYNVDEGAHFVPRAIGMFDQSYDPGYFINPPGLTYVLHAVFQLRWGGGRVQELFAVDPTAVWSLARGTVAVLATASVAALAWAGVRLFDGRVALVAAGLLAVAFLPVHYGHFALNDAPTLLPAGLCLVGVAGVLHRGRPSDFLLAGGGLGAAIAFKYTAGILLLALLAATWLSPVGRRGRLVGLGAAGALTILAFLVLNPYALLDFSEFRRGLAEQSATSGDGGGKLGLADTSGVRYYASTLTWGLGWLPLVAALGGAGGLVRRDRRTALVLLAPLLAFLVFMGLQDRFFARWLLPVYPLLALLAAWGAVHGLTWLAARLPRRLPAWVPALVALVALGAQGLVYAIHNDVVLAREDTRAIARRWMVDHLPVGSKVVLEPIAPNSFVADVGRPSPTRTGERFDKRPWSHFAITPKGKKVPLGDEIRLEDYVRTLRPDLLGSYTRGGYCWVIKGSTMYGRAYVTPKRAPYAVRYYRALERRGTKVFQTSPLAAGADEPPFSFDDSYNARPLGYRRTGPRIVIYRLHGDRCGPRGGGR